MLRLLCLLYLIALAPQVALAFDTPRNGGNPSWYDRDPWSDPNRGFYWYPDPPAPSYDSPPQKEEARQPTIYEMTSMEDIRKELVRMRDVAILNPSQKAVHDYLKAQAWAMDKSSVFADVARRVVWANPDVDYNGKSPTANFSRLNERQREDRSRAQTMRQLAQDEYGILFFARSDCRYCHDQAPVLRAFSNSTGLEVLAISLDGGPIPSFPDAKRDNGISMMASGGEGIQSVPATFLINRRTKEITPLGTGVIAGEDLAERIRVVTRTRPGEEF